MDEDRQTDGVFSSFHSRLMDRPLLHKLLHYFKSLVQASFPLLKNSFNIGALIHGSKKRLEK